MPINAATLVAVVGLVLAIAVWVRTRRVGPVAGVLVGAFVVMAITTPSILQTGGQKVGDAINWAFSLLTF
jgi:hypothetical protein